MAYSSLMVDIFLKRPRGGGEGGGAGEGGTPYNGLYGEASPKKKTLFRLHVYKRVGIY